MNLSSIITALCSLFFLMIGADKFFSFLEPPCSLEENIPATIWILFGLLQVASGVLIWSPRFKKHIAGFWAVFMVVFIIVHLVMQTYDIGGAIFMAVLLGILVWDPPFLKRSITKGQAN